MANLNKPYHVHAQPQKWVSITSPSYSFGRQINQILSHSTPCKSLMFTLLRFTCMFHVSFLVSGGLIEGLSGRDVSGYDKRGHQTVVARLCGQYDHKISGAPTTHRFSLWLRWVWHSRGVVGSSYGGPPRAVTLMQVGCR